MQKIVITGQNTGLLIVIRGLLIVIRAWWLVRGCRRCSSSQDRRSLELLSLSAQAMRASRDPQGRHQKRKRCCSRPRALPAIFLWFPARETSWRSPEHWSKTERETCSSTRFLENSQAPVLPRVVPELRTRIRMHPVWRRLSLPLRRSHGMWIGAWLGIAPPGRWKSSHWVRNWRRRMSRRREWWTRCGFRRIAVMGLTRKVCLANRCRKTWGWTWRASWRKTHSVESSSDRECRRSRQWTSSLALWRRARLELVHGSPWKALPVRSSSRLLVTNRRRWTRLFGTGFGCRRRCRARTMCWLCPGVVVRVSSRNPSRTTRIRTLQQRRRTILHQLMLTTWDAERRTRRHYSGMIKHAIATSTTS